MIEPPLSQWPSESWRPDSETLAALRQRAQQRLILDARRWLNGLYQSEQHALPENLLTGHAPRPMIVMTGHQPVIFHPGLAAKYVIAESFARQHQAAAIALIIDTDEGDAGEFQYPSLSGASASVSDAASSGSAFARANNAKKMVRSASIAANCGLYHSSQLRSASERQAIFSSAVSGLRACGCEEAAIRAEKVFEEYLSLKTTSTIAANTLVRRSQGIGRRMLEIPLSAVCNLPEVLQFFGTILNRATDFHQCYNASLDQFRSENNIRNEANPFPNLKHSGDQFELPFWIVNSATGTREIVSLTLTSTERWLCAAGQRLTEMHRGLEMESLTSLLFKELRLVPRGALITAMLRMLFSDIFIHGTGGGRYDEFTDRLIHAWWNEQPSPVAVVTTSQYLFQDQRQRYEKLQLLNIQLRDLQFNPQRYFGRGLFSADDELQLTQLVASRDQKVATMKNQRGEGQSGKQLGKEIQQLNDQLKDLVAKLLAPSLQELQQFDEATVKTLQTRTWPWFYSDGIVV